MTHSRRCPGTSFRPAYTRLKDVFDSWEPRPPLMALTATANKRARRKIRRLLGLHQPHVVVTSFDRKNIRYEVRYPDSWVAVETLDADLLTLLREPDALGNPLRCAVVYCRAKDECDRVAKLITRAGISAAAYHAGLSSKERQAVQANWRSGSVVVAVATVAFGMGASRLCGAW